jgi:hypothetical protein
MRRDLAKEAQRQSNYYHRCRTNGDDDAAQKEYYLHMADMWAALAFAVHTAQPLELGYVTDAVSAP